MIRRTSVFLLFVCLFAASVAEAACSFSFLSETTFPAGTNPGDVASGDFNHDGRNDLAIVNRQSANVAILLGSQDGSFGSPTFVSAGSTSQGDIVAAFINADDHLDLVVIGGPVGVPPFPDYPGQYVQVLLGNGTGGFTTGDDELINSSPERLVAADFDNDDDIDIAATVASPGKFFLLLNNGAGVLTQKSITQAMSSSLIMGMAAGDFDADGNLDVALADWVGDRVQIFHGAGDGTFTLHPTAITTTTVANHDSFTVAAGDFDSDGDDDLAVGNRDGYGGGGVTMAIVLSNGGARTFAASTQYGSMGGVGAQDITAADVTGDGILDAIVAGMSFVHVFRGNGDGTVTEEPAFGSGGLGLATLDVDNNGGLDLAATHFSAGTVGILQNACGSVTLDVTASGNPVSHGNNVTITATVTSNPAATGTLTLSLLGSPLAETDLATATSVSDTLMLDPGQHEFVATYSGDDDHYETTRTILVTVQTAPFGPPPGFAANSSGGTVQLTWFATSGTAKYEIWRNSGTGFAKVGETTNVTFNDTPPASSALLYKVRPVSPGGVAGDFSNADFTISYSFTDATIIPRVTGVKALHVAELRDAANAFRALAGLPPATWTDSTTILAAQFNELRTAINAARTALGFGAALFSETLTTGVPVRQTHLTGLREAMR